MGFGRNEANGRGTRMIECEICGGAVPIPDGATIGELLECPTCAAELELLTLDPPSARVFEEDEK
jgi:alpha-aminoadipate carrier protein LysW